MVSMADPVTRRKPKPVPVYPCAIYGREITAVQAVYSKWSGRRFCSPTIGHLGRRKT